MKISGTLFALLLAVVCFSGCEAKNDITSGTIIPQNSGATITSSTSAPVNITETTSEEHIPETIMIAGQEYPADETDVLLYGKAVTDEDILKISNLKSLKNLSIDLIAEGSSVTDLTPLSELSSLEALSLNGTYTDLGFLKGMTSLKDLSFMNFVCGAPENVPENKSITSISFDRSSVHDLSWLANFANVKKIDLAHFSSDYYTGYPEIKNLNNLESFSMTSSVYNGYFYFLENIKTLKEFTFEPLPSLEEYNFYELSDCTGLEKINIYGSCASLAFCRKLENLKEFSYTSDDEFEYDVSPLLDCSKLEKIDLCANCNEESLEMLKNKFNNGQEITVSKNTSDNLLLNKIKFELSYLRKNICTGWLDYTYGIADYNDDGTPEIFVIKSNGGQGFQPCSVYSLDDRNEIFEFKGFCRDGNTYFSYYGDEFIIRSKYQHSVWLREQKAESFSGNGPLKKLFSAEWYADSPNTEFYNTYASVNGEEVTYEEYENAYNDFCNNEFTDVPYILGNKLYVGEEEIIPDDGNIFNAYFELTAK